MPTIAIKLYRNLDQDTLMTFFETCGEISNFTIVNKLAFMTFSSYRSLRKALSFSGTKLNGSPLKIWAIPLTLATRRAIVHQLSQLRVKRHDSPLVKQFIALIKSYPLGGNYLSNPDIRYWQIQECMRAVKLSRQVRTDDFIRIVSQAIINDITLEQPTFASALQLSLVECLNTHVCVDIEQLADEMEAGDEIEYESMKETFLLSLGSLDAVMDRLNDRIAALERSLATARRTNARRAAQNKEGRRAPALENPSESPQQQTDQDTSAVVQLRVLNQMG